MSGPTDAPAIRVMDGRLDLVIGAFHQALPALAYPTLFDEEHPLCCGTERPLFRLSDSTVALEDLASAA